MHPYKNKSINLLARIVPAACTLLLLLPAFSSLYAQRKVPVAWQPGMKLSMTYSGGMTPYSSELLVTAEGCRFVSQGEGKTTRHDFTLSPTQLNDLLAFLAKNRLNKIESRSTLVYDKGTRSILLSWEGRVLGVSDGSSMEVEEKYRDSYYAICSYLEQLPAKGKVAE